MAKQEVALLDNELSVLDAIELKKEEILEWVKTAENYVVTPETVNEANAFRKKGKNYRLEVQRISGRNNDKLNKLKKINGEREDEFVVKTGLESAEKKFEARIKAVEAALEAERQAKIKAEEERKRRIKTSIAQIETKTSVVRSMNDIDELKELSKSIKELSGTFDEFNEDGNAAVLQCLTSIGNRISILEDEKEIKQRLEVKISTRKEMLTNYPQGYWPTDEELGVFSQEEFEEAIIHIQAKVKADAEDSLVEKAEEIVEKDDNSAPFAGYGTMYTIGEQKNLQTLGLNWKEETISDIPERKIEKQAPTYNQFEVNGYQFGLDTSIPFGKAVEIREAIERILSA